MRNILKNYQNWNERCALELARSTGEPSIHQNDAPIYSWTSIKCQKFFSIFSFSFSIRFLFLFAAAHFKRDATASSLTLEIGEWFVWLQCRSCMHAVYVNDIGAPCHAPSVFGSQCGSQKVAHPLRRRHVSTLFSPADTPPVGKWSSTGLPCVLQLRMPFTHCFTPFTRTVCYVGVAVAHK